MGTSAAAAAARRCRTMSFHASRLNELGGMASSESPREEGTAGRVRIAAFMCVVFFLVLICVAWRVGATRGGAAAHAHATYLHYWRR